VDSDGPPGSGSGSIVILSDPDSNKQKSKKNLYTVLWLYDFLSSKTDVNVHSKNNKQKN
jgi:hypothetical protein